MWQTWADDNKTGHKMFKNVKHSGIWWLYLVSPWEMQWNKYKHAWYGFRNLWNFENFVKTKRFCTDGETNGCVQSIKVHSSSVYHNITVFTQRLNLIWMHFQTVAMVLICQSVKSLQTPFISSKMSRNSLVLTFICKCFIVLNKTKLAISLEPFIRSILMMFSAK